MSMHLSVTSERLTVNRGTMHGIGVSMDGALRCPDFKFATLCCRTCRSSRICAGFAKSRARGKLSRGSVQGNCSAPTKQSAERMSLPEATVAGMQAMLPGQCVVVFDKSWLRLKEGNKWLDNLHMVIAPDKMVPQITAVALTSEMVFDTYQGLNIFITRMTFQSSPLVSARAVGVYSRLLEQGPSDALMQSILVQSAIQQIITTFTGVRE